MSSNPIHKQALQELLTCSICVEIFTKPLTLPCFHSFCRHCLQELLDHDKEKNNVVDCPLCREPAAKEDFKENFMVKQFLEVYNEPAKPKKCELCEERGAEYHCTDRGCKINVCNSCKTMHLKTPSCKHHKIISMSDMDNSVIDVAIYCQKHEGKPLDRYCEDCKKPICDLCQAVSHAGHKISEIDDAIQAICPEFQCNIEKIKLKIRDNEEELEYFNTQIKETEQMFEKAKKSVIDIIEKKKEQSLAKLEEAKRNSRDTLQSKQSLVQFSCTTLERTKHVSLLNELSGGLAEKVGKESEQPFIPITIITHKPKVDDEAKCTVIGYEAQFMGTEQKCSRHFPGNYMETFESIAARKSTDVTIAAASPPGWKYRRLAVINEEIWAPVLDHSHIEVYSAVTLEHKRTIPVQNMGIPWSLMQYAENQAVFSSTTGLYRLSIKEECFTEIVKGCYFSLFINVNLLAACEAREKKVLFFERNIENNWVKLTRQVDVGYKELFNNLTAVVVGNFTYVTLFEGKRVLKYDADGALLNEDGNVSQSWACGVDMNGSVLVSDETGLKIKIYETLGQSHTHQIQAVQKIRDIIFSKNAAYVLWYDSNVQFYISKFSLL